MFVELTILKKGKKGQVFPILITVVVILIIAALISANLGKVSLDRLYTIQGADAGAIAGISDFTCGYNKATYAHLVMPAVAVAIQIYLLFPKCWFCYPYRHLWATVARLFNSEIYEWAKKIVQGYSSAARKDAYYYAFVNAGIDDKYKWDPVEGRYRDKPHAGETWERWVSLKSAFSKWLNDLPSGWQDSASLTYRWQNGSKWVTVYLESSPPEDLDSFQWPLIGIYLWFSTKCLCCIPSLLWHGNIHFFLDDPPERWVRVRVERSYTEQTRDLVFWRVRQPTTTARARTRMTGDFSWPSVDNFDFSLEE